MCAPTDTIINVLCRCDIFRLILHVYNFNEFYKNSYCNLFSICTAMIRIKMSQIEVNKKCL